MLGLERARGEGAVGQVLVLGVGGEAAVGAHALVAVAAGDRVADELDPPREGLRCLDDLPAGVGDEADELGGALERLGALLDPDVVLAVGQALGDRVVGLTSHRLDLGRRAAVDDHGEIVVALIHELEVEVRSGEAGVDGAARPREARARRVAVVEAANEVDVADRPGAPAARVGARRHRAARSGVTARPPCPCPPVPGCAPPAAPLPARAARTRHPLR